MPEIELKCWVHFPCSEYTQGSLYPLRKENWTQGFKYCPLKGIWSFLSMMVPFGGALNMRGRNVIVTREGLFLREVII